MPKVWVFTSLNTLTNLIFNKICICDLKNIKMLNNSRGWQTVIFVEINKGNKGRMCRGVATSQGFTENSVIQLVKNLAYCIWISWAFNGDLGSTKVIKKHFESRTIRAQPWKDRWISQRHFYLCICFKMSIHIFYGALFLSLLILKRKKSLTSMLAIKLIKKSMSASVFCS